jgi:hypothetical protein
MKAKELNEKQYEKLIISVRAAQANEYSLDKEQTSYDDMLDAFRLSLKGYNIRLKHLLLILPVN